MPPKGQRSEHTAKQVARTREVIKRNLKISDPLEMLPEQHRPTSSDEFGTSFLSRLKQLSEKETNVETIQQILLDKRNARYNNAKAHSKNLPSVTLSDVLEALKDYDVTPANPVSSGAPDPSAPQNMGRPSKEEKARLTGLAKVKAEVGEAVAASSTAKFRALAPKYNQSSQQVTFNNADTLGDVAAAQNSEFFPRMVVVLHYNRHDKRFAAFGDDSKVTKNNPLPAEVDGAQHHNSDVPNKRARSHESSEVSGDGQKRQKLSDGFFGKPVAPRETSEPLGAITKPQGLPVFSAPKIAGSGLKLKIRGSYLTDPIDLTTETATKQPEVAAPASKKVTIAPKATEVRAESGGMATNRSHLMTSPTFVVHTPKSLSTPKATVARKPILKQASASKQVSTSKPASNSKPTSTSKQVSAPKQAPSSKSTSESKENATRIQQGAAAAATTPARGKASAKKAPRPKSPWVEKLNPLRKQLDDQYRLLGDHMFSVRQAAHYARHPDPNVALLTTEEKEEVDRLWFQYMKALQNAQQEFEEGCHGLRLLPGERDY